MAEISLIVGLGNPGAAYERTRHNAGFLVVDRLAERWGRSWKRRQSLAEISAADPLHTVILAKPLTYMNESGRAAGDLARYHRISPSEILVVADDFALPLGTLRLRRSGSAGGHNGLCSVIEHLGTSDFPRLRLGIGPVPPQIDPADFVLGRFAEAEQETLRSMIERAGDVVENILASGLEKALSQMGRTSPADKP